MSELKKIKSKGSPSASKKILQRFLIMGVPQIILFYSIFVFLFILNICPSWGFIFELVDSFTTLRKVEAQQNC